MDKAQTSKSAKPKPGLNAGYQFCQCGCRRYMHSGLDMDGACFIGHHNCQKFVRDPKQKPPHPSERYGPYQILIGYGAGRQNIQGFGADTKEQAEQWAQRILDTTAHRQPWALILKITKVLKRKGGKA